MGVEHHVPPGGRALLEPTIVPELHVVEGAIDLGGSAAEFAGGRGFAVISDVDDMQRQAAEIGTVASRDTAAGHRNGGAAARGEWRLRDAGPHDPGIVGRVEPVLVGERGEAVLPPVFSPGIMYQETDLVVADEREGVATSGDLVDRRGNRHNRLVTTPELR